MYACMDVCMYGCMYVFMYVCMHACTYVSMHPCVYLHFVLFFLSSWGSPPEPLAETGTASLQQWAEHWKTKVLRKDPTGA